MGGTELKAYLQFLTSDEIFDTAIKRQLIRPLLEKTVAKNALLFKGINIRLLIHGLQMDEQDREMAERIKKFVTIGLAMHDDQEIQWGKGSDLGYLDSTDSTTLEVEGNLTKTFGDMSLKKTK